MSFVGIANSLMSTFLLSYFSHSSHTPRLSFSRRRLLRNKARLLPNKGGLLNLNRHSKKMCFFLENNWVIVWWFRKYFVPL